MEFYCPYCRGWINDTVHRQSFHNDIDEPDEVRDDRIRVDGVTYEDEIDYETETIRQMGLKHGLRTPFNAKRRKNEQEGN